MTYRGFAHHNWSVQDGGSWRCVPRIFLGHQREDDCLGCHGEVSPRDVEDYLGTVVSVRSVDIDLVMHLKRIA